MTEHQRVARDVEEPAPSSSGTSELFAAYLAYARETIIRKVTEVDAELSAAHCAMAQRRADNSAV